MIRLCAALLLLVIASGRACAQSQPTTAPGSAPAALPRVVIQRDDTVIAASCRLEPAPGVLLSDPNRNGVIQIGASDIVVDLGDATFHGGRVGEQPDTFSAIAIRVNGHKNVTIRGGTLRGFRTVVWASAADGLVLDGVTALDNWRSRLRSSVAAEDLGDWLFPHDNDANEWLTKYSAAYYIEDARGVLVRNCRAAFGQNALCLDRVDDSQVYDNDFSFNSGWGVALWRSSGNVICRNAADFCIRGYSHGVYNRGQDSAGILLFEQCSRNTIALNSATHCGDGLFAFAGKEALGERSPPGLDHAGRGCNENLIYGNDFSYAAAHGLELTFSFDNVILRNRLVSNAICGIWAGYSQRTLIADNEIIGNGLAGRLEGGGINIEHGRANRILNNRFEKNAVGVHLWWDEDEALARQPWVKANGGASTENLIARNRFSDEPLALRLRGPGDAAVAENQFNDVRVEVEADPGFKLNVLQDAPAFSLPPLDATLPGAREPVGARAPLAGREQIIIGDFGPWDHRSMFVRAQKTTGPEHIYELYEFSGRAATVLRAFGLSGSMSRGSDPVLYTLTATHPGALPYELTFGGGGGAPGNPPVLVYRARNAIVDTQWNIAIFAWDDARDPRQNLDGWRQLARTGGPATRPSAAEGAPADAAAAPRFVATRELKFDFAGGGPDDVPALRGTGGPALSRDRFGLIARTAIEAPPGKWQVVTRSDDGVRVSANGKVLIENWSHHGPTRDVAPLTLDTHRIIDFEVEYFEIDGYAVLEFELAPVDVPIAE